MESAHAASDSVCAKVGLRLDQSAVMTRTAFRATLELSNNDPDAPLSALSASVEVKDATGQPANGRFSIEAPILDHIDRVDGSGNLAASSRAVIRWLLIPADDAAPTAPTDFFVGGQFSYQLYGNQVRVPLDAVKITVYPDAALDLQYFHQRDVFSDDPFTPQIEPALPYSLAVMVRNRGAGAAKSLKISSAQPQIVSNEKGLLIDFTLVSTALDGTNVPNSLALDFGQIDPGAIKITEWKFTSTLQGFFRDFSATFQHEDTLGSTRLSTIKSVSIHEMTHLVQAGYEFEDGKSDFLVNDAPDPDNLPDTIYLSDGTTNPVNAVQSYIFDSIPSSTNLQVQLTTPTFSGWTYLRVPEPSGGQLALTSVRRSDGVTIRMGTNVWTTDRLFTGPGVRPIRTNLLHLLDYNSTGAYTLYYNNALPADTTAPASLVAALPAQSSTQIPVMWSGQDNDGGSGVASFDLFVSENNGPFLLWLQQTALRGAIYSGTIGSTYAFYSSATDYAGNREAAHGAADAKTSATLINHPPVLPAVAVQTLDEGQTLSLAITATDPDLPANVLTYSLGPGAPGGVTLNPNSGLLTWVTSEAHGPSTNLLTIMVTDNGIPPLTTTGLVTVIVREVNSPPILAPVSNRTINEGQLLSIMNLASDQDLPPQHLTFSLRADAPVGAAINHSTGLFTWRPSDIQGGATNTIAVIVTDDGPPPLSATQTFSVIVRDTNPNFQLTLGTTQLLSGASSSVPLRLHSGIDLNSVSLVMAVSGNRLTNLKLLALAPNVGAADFVPLDSGRFNIQFHSRSDALLQGDFPLAQIGFDTISNAHSIITTLRAESLTGGRSATPLPLTGKAIPGAVFIIGAEPILEAWLSTNVPRMLTLYGRPGSSYSISSNTNPASSNWVSAWRVPLTNLAQTFPADAQSAQIFYRAAEFLADPPSIEPRLVNNARALLVYGIPGTHYQLQASTNLSDPAAWLSVFNYSMTNSFQQITNVGGANPIIFYRVKPVGTF